VKGKSTPDYCHNQYRRWNDSLLEIAAASNDKKNNLQKYKNVLKEAKITVIDYECENTDMNVVVLELRNILEKKYYTNVWAVVSWPFPIVDNGWLKQSEQAWYTRKIKCAGKITHTVMIMFDKKGLPPRPQDENAMKEQLLSIPLSKPDPNCGWFCSPGRKTKKDSREIAKEMILEYSTIAYIVTRAPRINGYDNYYTHQASSSAGVTVSTVRRLYNPCGNEPCAQGNYGYTLTGVGVYRKTNCEEISFLGLSTSLIMKMLPDCTVKNKLDKIITNSCLYCTTSL